MKGKRNLTIILAGLGLVGWLAWILGAEGAQHLPATIGAVALFVTGGVAARAGNKWAESKGGELQ